MKRAQNHFYHYMFWRSFLPLLLFLVIIGISFQLFYHVSVKHEEEQNRANNISRLETCVFSTEQRMKEIERYGTEVITGLTFQKFVYMFDDLDIYSRFSLQQEIQTSLYNLYSRHIQVNNVMLYLPSMKKVISSSHAQTSIKPWLQDLEEKENETRMLPDGTWATILHWHGDEEEAILMIVWNTAGMIDQIEDSFLSGSDSIEWIWDYGEEPGEDMIYADSHYYPFRLIYQQKGSSQFEQFFKLIELMSIIFMIICLFIAAISIFTWYKQIYRPLHRLLVEAFDHMEQNDFSYRIQMVTKNTFFHPIYDKYNHMAESMQKYIETNLQQQILVSQSNLKQLQSQISPHFMYNSYYILYRMLRKGDTESSLHLAEYLGNFYHYITRNADDEKHLYEELNHARDYAKIQQYRFRDNLSVSIPDPDEKIANVYVPRLILQPILENAFKYAYESSSGDPMELKISFDVRNEKDFDIFVENSGEVTNETLDMIREKLAVSDMQIETTAIININRRLKIYFGKKSGLRAERSNLGGLKVILHINCEDDSEEEQSRA